MASNHSILPSGHISFVPCYGSVLLSLPLGGSIAIIVCTFLLWALLPLLCVNASRYLIKCAECQITLHILHFFQAGRSQPPYLQQIYPSNSQTKTFHDNHATIITTNTTPPPLQYYLASKRLIICGGRWQIHCKRHSPVPCF